MQVKPAANRAIDTKQAVVCTCKDRTGKATVTKINADYMTGQLVASDSVPRTTISAFVPCLCLGLSGVGDINERKQMEHRKRNSMKDETTPVAGKAFPFCFSPETNRKGKKQKNVMVESSETGKATVTKIYADYMAAEQFSGVGDMDEEQWKRNSMKFATLTPIPGKFFPKRTIKVESWPVGKQPEAGSGKGVASAFETNSLCVVEKRQKALPNGALEYKKLKVAEQSKFRQY
ncbi:hypothetical protein GQ457_01G049440 [Hibiscus cannabinus]